MALSARVVRALAFWRGSLLLGLGYRGQITPGKNTEERARRYLSRLREPADGLRCRMALADLVHEYDLLDEGSALLPDARALQCRVHELAKSDPIAQEALRFCGTAPIAKLLRAIVQQGAKDRAREVRIDFTAPDAGPFKVWYRVAGEWMDAMTIPATLSEPLRGLAVRVEAVGYATWRSVWPNPDEPPESATFTFPTPMELHVALMNA